MSRGWRAALGSVLLALVALATDLWVPPAPAAATGEPSLALLAQTPWVAPNGRFDLDLRVGGAPPDATLTIDVYRDVAERGLLQFDETVHGNDLGARIGGPPTVPLDALPPVPGGGVRAGFAVSSGGEPPPFGVRLDGDGVYPVSVTVADGAGVELDRLVTHLVRLPEGDARPLATALVVPVHAAPAFQPGGSVALPTEEQRRLDEALGVLSAGQPVPLTLRVTPETLDALNASSPEGAARVQALAGSLGGRQVLAAPYVRVDQGSLAGAEPGGDEELLRQLDAGRVVLQHLLGARTDLTTVVTDRSMPPGLLAQLRASGTRQVVVPTDQLRGELETPLRRFDLVVDEGEPVPAVAADPAIARRLTETDDPVLNAHLLLADLAMRYHEAPNTSRGAVVLVPDDAAVHPLTYAALFEGLRHRAPPEGGSPIVSPVTIDGLFIVTSPQPGSTRGSVATLEYEADEPAPATALLERVAATRSTIASFASMATSPEGTRLVASLDRQVLVAEARGLTDDQRAAHLDQVGDFIGTQIAQIHAQDDQQVTLTSRSDRIRISIENQLDYAVEVEVVLESTKLELPDGAAQTVTLAPASVTTIEATVEARASGAFPVDVTVRSPDDQIHLARSTLTVRSTAISGVGLVISIGAGLFLLLWWARHFRSVRRARRLVGSAHPAVVSSRAPSPESPSATLPATDRHPVEPAPVERSEPAGEPAPDAPARRGPVNGGKHAERPHRH